jgi:hypothetical protein
LKNVLIPKLLAQKKRIICIDPNLEYKPTRNFVVFRLIDYENGAAEVEKMVTYYLNGKHKKPDVIICDESNVVFDKMRLEPATKKLVNTLRHEKIDLILVARRPVDINITMSELARERYVFRVSGVNDIKRLNDISAGLGDNAARLEQHDYYHIVDDSDITLIPA